ncbi:MAG TPA: OB-fold domain-containing protein [Actinomycetota bacterium]|nr:OB-fold domain-containing protein [Actinomycetota bacterium]
MSQTEVRTTTEEGFILPLRDDDSAGFWEGALQGELRMQRCGGCGRLRFPPRPMCPWCHSVDSDWQVMTGRGTIWSFVTAHPPLLPAYAALAPYNVIVVALDEDPTLRLVGNLLASKEGPINEIDPATIAIGEPVRVVFQKIDDSTALPRWVRAG